MHRLCVRVVLTLSLVVCTQATVTGASYDFVTIDVPGAVSTYAHAINNKGQIVGGYEFDYRTQGFLLVKGQFTTVTAPTGDSTLASGIDNKGNIVGTFTSGEQSGFLLKKKKGVFTTIDVDLPDSGLICMTRPEAINNQGRIAGQYLDHCDAANGQHGFVYNGRAFTPIDVPGATVTAVTGLNDHGAVVGFYEDSGTGQVLGFLRSSRGNVTSIDGAFPLAINNAGNIVGWYIDDGIMRGFVSTSVTADDFSPIDFPGASMTVASDINQSGQVVGWYYDDTGAHGFVANPIKVKKGKR
jgi:uncharacterized membrane protein